MYNLTYIYIHSICWTPNAKKSELQPTYSDLVQSCHIARRWLSTGIILSQTETDHKQWAFPHRYAYFKFPKVDSFYTALAFYLDGTPNHWPTLLTHVFKYMAVSSCCPENHWWSLKYQGFCHRIQLCWSVEVTQNTPEGAGRDLV